MFSGRNPVGVDKVQQRVLCTRCRRTEEPERATPLLAKVTKSDAFGWPPGTVLTVGFLCRNCCGATTGPESPGRHAGPFTVQDATQIAIERLPAGLRRHVRLVPLVDSSSAG